MPRIESVALGGYYPTPTELIPAIAGLIDAAPAFSVGKAAAGEYSFFDPCAGDGSALLRLAQHWFGSNLKKPRWNGVGSGPQLKFYACEMELVRAKALREKLDERTTDPVVFHADAFSLFLDTKSRHGIVGAQGFSLLFLNPPYDTDKLTGRLEQKFLARFTPFVKRGSGLLIFIVPFHALAASAELLATEYEQVTCARFSHPQWDDYKQVVLVARRQAHPAIFGADPAVRERVLGWASNAETIPVLPANPVPVAAFSPFETASGVERIEATGLDLMLARQLYQPWVVGGLGAATGKNETFVSKDAALEGGLAGLLGKKLTVALPPKPAHLAMALASDKLNGKRLEPNPTEYSRYFPPLLVKGNFTKAQRVTSTKQDDKGNVTSETVIEQASLSVEVLDLVTFQFHTLKSGTEPSGVLPGDTNNLNIADLLVHYSQSLTKVMASQFPALHHPANPAHQMWLPQLGRLPFKAQLERIQTLLKLIARGKRPFLLGEVGTGKTGIALAVLAALSAKNYARTMREFRRLGLVGVAYEDATGLVKKTGKPPKVERALVFVPPHLLTSWANEVQVILPGANVVVVETISDLYREANVYRGVPGAPGEGLVIYLVAQTTAKLGHAFTAVKSLTCPKCGRPHGMSAAAIVRERAGCPRQVRIASDSYAKLATDLAGLLYTSTPASPLIRELVAGQSILARAFSRVQRQAAEWDSQPQSQSQFQFQAQEREQGQGQEHAAEAGSLAEHLLTKWASRALGINPASELVITFEQAVASPIGRFVSNLVKRIEWQIKNEKTTNTPRLVEVVEHLLLAVIGLAEYFSQPQLLRELVEHFARRLFSTVTSVKHLYAVADAVYRCAYKLMLAVAMTIQPAQGSAGSGSSSNFGDMAIAGFTEWAATYLAKTFDETGYEHKRLTAADSLHAQFGRTYTRLLRQQKLARQVLDGKLTTQEFSLQILLEPEQSAKPYGYHTASLVISGISIDATGRVQTADGYLSGEGIRAKALEILARLGKFEWSPVCGEPLYAPQLPESAEHKRRYPISRYIKRHMPGYFQALIVDEAHEANTEGSAQERAAHRLCELPGCIVMALTGSLNNGYASSLFMNMWALSHDFRKLYGREEKQSFIDTFGYRKLLRVKEGRAKDSRVAGYGAISDRVDIVEDYATRQLGEAPGVNPAFIMNHLLPIAVPIHKDDLDEELPPLVERPVYLEPDATDKADCELRASYERMRRELTTQIKADMYQPGMSGRLWGAITTLVAWFDLASADTGNRLRDAGQRVFELGYSQEFGGNVVTSAPLLPQATLTAKEKWVLACLREELASGRNVCLFIHHTQLASEKGKAGGLVERWKRLCETELGETPIYLDSERVTAKGREHWINQKVVGAGRRIMLANPESVKTGLNNLVYFSTAIFLEVITNPYTYRQVIGRFHRIGQTEEVRVFYPVYAGTAQVGAYQLLMRKVAASKKVDGLAVSEALEAVGATTDAEASYLSQIDQLSMGQAIYNLMMQSAE